MSHLLQVFPSARLEVYVASEAEVAEFECPAFRCSG
jgi:hypothetical protein